MPKLKREKVIGENGIYYPLSKEPNHYDILVSMRIGDKQPQRKKKNVKNLTNARKVRDDLVAELEKMKAELNRGDIFWSQAVEQYLKHLD